MKRKLAVLFSIMIMATAVLTGCGKGGGVASGKNLKFLFVLNAMDSFRETLIAGAQEAAAAEGATVDVVDANGDIEAQTNFVKDAKGQGYQAILCCPISTDIVVELKASADDLPIIFLNGCPDEKQLKKDKYVFAGSDEFVAGQYQAEYVLEKLGSKDELNVALLQGEKGHPATVGRESGVKQTLEASGKKVNYVFSDYADWDAERAKRLFELFLRTGSGVDCVLCQNDSMALGVIEACKEANVDLSTLPVLGVDATADGCTAIKNGEMAFTVCQNGVAQGQAAVKAALRFAQGESADSLEGISEDGKYVWVPFEKVDSTNVSQYSN